MMCFSLGFSMRINRLTCGLYSCATELNRGM